MSRRSRPVRPAGPLGANVLIGDDISATGPVATKVLNWGFEYC